MAKHSYDPKNRESILKHARLLLNKSLSDLYKDEFLRAGGKGDFGLLVEWVHFGKKQDSFSEPDFPAAGLELKTHPIKRYKNKKGYTPKERLVFSKISYDSFTDKSQWELKTSKFWHKNKCLLLMTYLFEEDKDLFEYIFKIIRLWEFPAADLKIIEDDWRTIVGKIRAGEAHLLSGGDTLYLEACTKGGTKQPQPFNATEKATSRAFALKPCYLRSIVEAELGHETFEPVVKSASDYRVHETFEDFVLRKFEPFRGLLLSTIAKQLNVSVHDSKNRYATLTNNLLRAILDVKRRRIAEFEKSDLIVRTCNFDQRGELAEHVSFPAFEFMDLVAEEWDDSEVKRILESRFLFIFLQETPRGVVLKRGQFWTMPIDDLETVKDVWERTVHVVKSGRIIKRETPGRRYTFFPNPSEHRIVHVRTHATTTDVTSRLPVPEKKTKAMKYTKHSFWLNKSYVRDDIFARHNESD